MRLLDLYSGAGGSAVGYNRAGFDEIVGVDIAPQKHYPFAFVLGDAIEYCRLHGREFDAIHASPPCQKYSSMGHVQKDRQYPDLVAPTREALIATGKPYIIENVVGAPLREPIVLCGTMFGLRTYRHRLFESNVILVVPTHPKHTVRVAKAGRPVHGGEFISVVGHFSDIALGRTAMGIDWIGRDKLAQAIPPAYTEYIGRQLLEAMRT